ncbi:NlpC/P60 family protein [Clostridium sp.]|uniref:C40 family peptidase n=1 Tax=Clostridium sp. TaxID=1506 RepID=UPI001A5CFB0A|nr:C40 family peptidase [Clostridium sp.]MBK5241997.1 C40 family peptidase [Clostridium sp.]
MRNALKNLAVTITLMLTLNVTALAVPTSGTLQPQKDQLTKVKTEREKVESKIEQLDSEIGINMTKTEENKVQIYLTEKAIKIAVVDIEKVESREESEEKLFNGRIRTMYMNGFDGYAEMMLGAENFGDFISRVENVRIIINFDKEVMNKFKATKIYLNEKKQSLNETKEVLLSLQVENKEKLDKIILAKESQKKLITQLNSKENVLLAEISNDEVSLNGTISNVNAIGDISQSRGAANVSQNAVVSYAATLLGTPYLWAGTSPSTGFDCSGFTQYVYRHFGISIGRSTGDQVRSGVGVSKDELEPGDLVFFGSSSNPQHTGIYIGDNKYIHSPRTGDVIKISSMTRRDYISGRRVR